MMAFKLQEVQLSFFKWNTFNYRLAIDQLEVWANRVDVPIIKQNMGSDPASCK